MPNEKKPGQNEGDDRKQSPGQGGQGDQGGRRDDRNTQPGRHQDGNQTDENGGAKKRDPNTDDDTE